GIVFEDEYTHRDRIEPCQREPRTQTMPEAGGMPGLDPDQRFDRHKAGIKAKRFVTDQGVRLLPELYEVYNSMPYEAAREMGLHQRGTSGNAGVQGRGRRRSYRSGRYGGRRTGPPPVE